MIQDLPSELVLKVVDYCQEEVRTVRCVSKRFHELIEPLFWRHVHMETVYKYDLEEEQCIKQFTQSRLRVKIMNRDYFDRLLNTRILTMAVDVDNSRWALEVARTVGPHIKFAGLVFHEPVPEMTQILHELGKDSAKFLMFNWHRQVIDFPFEDYNVISLSLSSCRGRVLNMEQRWDGLKRLSVHSPHPWSSDIDEFQDSYDSLVHVLNNCSGLSEVDTNLPWYDIVVDGILPASVTALTIVENTQNIQAPMNLNNIRSLTVNLLTGGLFQYLNTPNLERLALVGDYMFMATSVQALAKYLEQPHPKLWQLDLSCADLNDDFGLFSKCNASVTTLLTRLRLNRIMMSQKMFMALETVIVGEEPTAEELAILKSLPKLRRIFIDGNCRYSNPGLPVTQNPVSGQFDRLHPVYHDGYKWRTALHDTLYVYNQAIN